MDGGPWDKLLVLGKVVRPHGLAGLLRVWSYARSEGSFTEPGEVFLRTLSGRLRRFRVLSARTHKNVVLVALKGIDSLERAEELRGAEILVDRGSLARDEGEYFWSEIIGLGVFSERGEFLGTVSHIVPAGSNEIYVVKNGDKEILIPATHEVVMEIDPGNGKMVVSPMEGLLDLNEI